MKEGKSLMEIVQQLEENRKNARDFVATSSKLDVTPDAKALVLPAGEFALTRHAERQLAEKVKLPIAVYDRFRDDHPDILVDMLRKLFSREPTQNLIRTLPGKTRAVLSPGFRTGLDNYGLADAVLPVLKDVGAQIASCEITDTKFYLKALMPHLDADLPVPEGLKVGVGHNWYIRKIVGALTIQNSEVGAGSLLFLPGGWEKACTNLASYKEEGLVKVHLGKRVSVGEEVSEYISDNTRRLDDAAFWSLARDHVKAMTDGRVFQKIVAKMLAARGDAIQGNPEKLVEVFAEKQGFTEVEKGGLLKHLVGSGEMTRYGLQWAVTRLSQDAQDYDRATELERLGGKVIELGKADWEVLAEAA